MRMKLILVFSLLGWGLGILAVAAIQNLNMWTVILISLISLLPSLATYIWARWPHANPEKTHTIEEQLDEIVLRLFTNHEEAIDIFDELISTQVPKQRVLSLYGVGGVGKSWLLRFYRGRAKLKGIIISLVDGSSTRGAVDVMTTIEKDLEQQGLEVTLFKRKLDQYRHIQAKVSQESKTWKFASKLAIDIGKQIPVVGSAASALEVISQDEFLSFLRNFLNKEDVDLYINPEQPLAEHLLEDLRRMALQRQIVLLFDAYEKALALDEWLRFFVTRLGMNISIVFAGQIPLSAHWRDLRPISRIIEIVPLKEDGAMQCLEKYAQEYLQTPLSLSEKAQIAKFSGGLPLAISMSMDLLSRHGVKDFSEVRGEVIDDLVSTLAEAESLEVKRALEVCSVLRWFDEDILNYMFKGENISVTYSFLRTLPYIRFRSERLALHDRVREAFLQQLKQRSIGRFIEIQKRCIAYFEESTMRYTDKDSSEYREAKIELVYHVFNADRIKGIILIKEEINEALAKSRLEYCDMLLAESAQYDLEWDNVEQWLKYWRGELAYRRGRWADATVILCELLDGLDHTQTTYILTNITLGRIYYQRGELTVSKEMFQASLRAMKVSGILMQGYVKEQLAKVYRMEGNLETAVTLHREAIEDSKKSGDQYQICSSRGSYGTTLIMLGTLLEGTESLTQSIQCSRELGYIQFVATGLRSRAVGQMYLGKLKDAELSAVESFQIAEQLGDVYNRGFARLALGQIYTERGDDGDLAHAMLESAIRDLKLVGATFDVGNAWIALGNHYRAIGDFDSAMQSLDRASEILLPLDFAYGLGWLHYSRGETFRLAGLLSEGLQAFTQAEQMAISIKSSYLRARSRLQMAEIAFAKGNQNIFRAKLEEVAAESEQMRYRDLLAMVAYNRGVVSLNDGSIEQAFNHFWQALANSIQYNCFLLDRIASKIKSVCKSQTDEVAKRVALSELSKLAGRWGTEVLGRDSTLSLEILNRESETNNSHSLLEKILLSP
jgi:tetratricopeptide (TPR) repeat protein